MVRQRDDEVATDDTNQMYPWLLKGTEEAVTEYSKQMFLWFVKWMRRKLLMIQSRCSDCS